MSSPISRKWEHAVVTGGAGFVGSHLCKALLDAGAAVTCVDDLSTSGRTRTGAGYGSRARRRVRRLCGGRRGG
ncbi:NAD-dependent epimerase/dehydratase family protein, partial [Streptomyces werraensis]|uniref:NAD-dependent epimerase/dehydratase family protein n=1 Tax=Streptomyces werraensis TaxID=68284 RepID=UPI00342A3E39